MNDAELLEAITKKVKRLFNYAVDSEAEDLAMARSRTYAELVKFANVYGADPLRQSQYDSKYDQMLMNLIVQTFDAATKAAGTGDLTTEWLLLIQQLAWLLVSSVLYMHKPLEGVN